MKLFILIIIYFLSSAYGAFAHEAEVEITNVAETNWVGPIIAFIIISGAVIIARIIRKKSSQQITNNNI